MNKDRVYLEHILEAIQRVESYTENNKELFFSTILVQDGVVRNLQVLAESTQKISESLKTRSPGVDWRAISGFRNILVHDYLGLDLPSVWGVIENRLPQLKKEIEEMLKNCV